MRTTDSRAREITEILADVVKSTSTGCLLTVPDGMGGMIEMECPEIHYIFGNSQYFKDNLDEMSTNQTDNAMKFPCIALFCPFTERRNIPGCFSKARVRLLIACSTMREWTNEQRQETSFRNVLRPIYRHFLAALKQDGRLDFGYEGHIPHEYSENYSYGRYGALTAAGEEVSEPIDAINITNLELIVKLPNCR